MTVGQIKTTWTGGPSAPGLTIFNVDMTGAADTGAALAAVRTFWASAAAAIPSDYSLTVEQVVLQYNEGTGQLTGSSSAAAPLASVSGIYAGNYASGVGARIDWKTVEIKNGRRVAGKTFVVPCGFDNFDADGALTVSAKTAFEGFADTLLENLATAGAPLVVWSRPSLKWPAGGITTVSYPDVPRKAAVLRGRRD